MTNPEFRVGDRVIVTGGSYSLTKRGSIGTILEILSMRYVKIRFDVLTHNYPEYPPPQIFDIATQYIALFEQPTPEQEIMNTINRLQKQQWFYKHIGKDLESWKYLENL